MGRQDELKSGMRILPLRLYVADYDRAFRLRDKIFGELDPWGSQHEESRGHEFWARSWNHNDDDEKLSNLRSEQRADLADVAPLYGPGGLYDGDQARRELRLHDRLRREREIQALRNRLLLDQRPDELDRPGPTSELDERTWGRIDWLAEMKRTEALLPGSFFLPLPPEKRDMTEWRTTVRRAIEEHSRP
jgi:hypothetical protein